jgi:type IV fimbrial biogenesis protein FimT
MKYLKNNSGFTLVELMVTLAIAAIVITQGVPSFVTMIQNNRLVTQTNDVATAINIARSEAVKRGVRVILCRSADPTATTPACGGTANTWTTGWLIFASGDTDNTYTDGTDTLLRIGQPAPTGITIMTNSTSNNNLEYNPDGTTNESGGTAVFAICDSRGESNGRQIQVNAMGRPQLVKGSSSSPLSSCTSPEEA